MPQVVILANGLRSFECCSHAQGREIEAKIMDSGVSRIQMWREQKKKQEKRKAYYEKNREKIIEIVKKSRKKDQEAKSGHG